MNHNLTSVDYRYWINQTLRDIFETMLCLKVEVIEGNSATDYPERVIGSIGLGGEQVSGAVFLQVSEKFAREMAAAMLGLKATEIKEDAEINDVISEVSNMLAGGLKSRLSDSGTPCAMSTPSIIRGSSFVIEAEPEVYRERVVFLCKQERVIVEFHLKFAQNE